MAKSSELPGFFICPACVVKDLQHDDVTFCPVHLEPGIWVDGTRYCELCGEQLLDALVIKVNSRLLRGRLTWGDKHSLAFALRIGGIFEVTVACPCEHGGIIAPFIYSFSKYSDYWSFLAATVAAHYQAIKAIID